MVDRIPFFLKVISVGTFCDKGLETFLVFCVSCCDDRPIAVENVKSSICKRVHIQPQFIKIRRIQLLHHIADQFIIIIDAGIGGHDIFSAVICYTLIHVTDNKFAGLIFRIDIFHCTDSARFVLFT